MNTLFTKRPDEVLDYAADFSRWLSTGDIINTATASIVSTSPDGVTPGTAHLDRTTYSSTTATAWLSAGLDGETVDLTIQIVTAIGRTKDAVMRIRIRDDG